MASVTKIGKGKQPPRAIDFVDPADGKRKRVRLGVVTYDVAQQAALRVEKLLSAKTLNQSIDSETAVWLRGVSGDVHDRLAKVGLCESRTPVLKAPTLGKWLTTFLDQKQHGLKPSSLKRLRQTGDRLEAHFGRDRDISTITAADAAAWRSSLAGDKLAEATVRLNCRNAKSIFHEAVDQQHIDSNPCSKLKSSSIAAIRDRYVTPEETRKLLDAAPNLQWKLLIALGRLAGLRIPSESHLLQWGHVDWERRRLQVYAPKTDSTRSVPIVPELHDILAEAYDAARVGSAEIVSLSTNNLQRNLRQIAERAGLQSLQVGPWQTLRRSAETMFAMTYPQHAVSQWIGHSVQISLKHYTMTPDLLFETVAAAPVLRAAESAAVSSGIGSQGAEFTLSETLPVSTPESEKAAKCWGKQHVTASCESGAAGTRTQNQRIMSLLSS